MPSHSSVWVVLSGHVTVTFSSRSQRHVTLMTSDAGSTVSSDARVPGMTSETGVVVVGAATVAFVQLVPLTRVQLASVLLFASVALARDADPSWSRRRFDAWRRRRRPADAPSLNPKRTASDVASAPPASPPCGFAVNCESSVEYLWARPSSKRPFLMDVGCSAETSRGAAAVALWII